MRCSRRRTESWWEARSYRFAALHSLAALLIACAGTPILGATDSEPGAQDERAPTQRRGTRMSLPSATEIAKLPPDGGSEFNRLVFEKSPYLLQHARNPVDWYPWGEAAFERARAEEKPIFLSIGYSTCHWCHVMEHESFEDEEVAALMNASFVCVKVDREERPDVDQLYMSYTQARTGSGGWPMTVILTPDRRPFFAGTYFPKNGRYGRPGMMELVPALARAWKEQREAVLADADAAVKALAQMAGGTPGGALDAKTLEHAWRQLRQMHDAQHGGFGDRPKFPIPHNLRFLLRWHARSGSAEALEVVTRTLDAMRRGGIWDHVGHGFHRYSTDAEWLVPHFEKMLYDQASMALAYVEAWQVTGEARHRRTAEEIFAYVLGEMTAPEGGFHSAEDADSEGEEGLFYLWTTGELERVLGEKDAELAAEVWNASPEGNFSDEATGRRTARNILHLREDPDAIAARLGLEPAALAARMESIRERLFAARGQRVRPLKDDKVLTDWNGLMIAALALAARAFDAPEYERAARRAADFALATLRDGTGRLYKRWRQGEAALPGVLDDYAFLAHGLLELHETSQELSYLEAALGLVEQAILHFEDSERGGFFLSADDGEELFVRTKDSYDGAIPSGNALMFSNLLRLARITADTRYEELAQRTLRSFSGDVARSPANHCQLLLALDLALGPSFEVVIAGDPRAADTRAMLRALHRPFRPNKVVLLRSDATAPRLAKLAPYTEEQRSVEGRATAYVCRDFACLAPTTEIARMLSALEKR